MKKKGLNQVLVFGLFLILTELIYKVLVYKEFFSSDTVYTILFCLPFIFLLMIIKWLPEKANKIVFYCVELAVTCYIAFQYCFHMFFATPFSFATLGLAGQAFDWGENIKNLIVGNWWQLILLFVPFIITIVSIKWISFKRYNYRHMILLFGLFLITYGSSILSLLINKKDIYSAYNFYYNINSVIDNYKTFGSLTATRLDLQRLIFKFDEKIINNGDFDLTNNGNNKDNGPVVYGDNITNIDFETLINNTNDSTLKSVHNYFSNRNATKQNKYTGMYKGKNIIYVLAEGFNEIAVDAERTPTLYKMINNSFVFKNFYSPVFLSTIGGEFQATTGLIPTQETLTNWKKNMVNIPYGIGNSFSKIGYDVQSYHDWTHTYYGRDKYMQNLGFYDYTGCGNGLEKRISCKWLPSDVDMINTTFPDYGNSEHFATYYVTVSAHAPYNFTGGNSTSIKYKNEVKDLNYSTNVKAYLASQMELDRAMEALLKNLEEKGILNDTVIVLMGDHYPYTLTIDEVNEVSNYKKDDIVEVNHSNLIIYNPETPKTEITKVGSQIDVLPTVLNLFGINYDSRLIIGRDILSEGEGLAMMSNRSWVTDSGTYFASDRKFVPKEGVTVSDDYVNNVNNIVSNNFAMSRYVINYDYYDKVLGE